MATEITETESVIRALKPITLGGQRFRVPLSPPLGYMFWMNAFLKKVDAQDIDVDDVQECYDHTVEFLELYNAKVDQDGLLKNTVLSDLILFYSRCYGANADEAEAVGERPTRRPRGTGGRSRTASKSRS